jgi:hypothetical protein
MSQKLLNGPDDACGKAGMVQKARIFVDTRREETSPDIGDMG